MRVAFLKGGRQPVSFTRSLAMSHWCHLGDWGLLFFPVCWFFFCLVSSMVWSMPDYLLSDVSV